MASKIEHDAPTEGADEENPAPEETVDPVVHDADPTPEAQAKLLEPSVTYLVEEEKPDLAYSLFLAMLKDGRRGMIVSRTYPKNLRKALDLNDVPVYWLTNAMSDEAIGPKDLERLTLTIRRFLDEGEGQLV
ncbi:MAG: DUF835 domain-containing protein, partial [Thermoplasmata archaeon]|nr:DUF835 domain-containing protein [Thermoplasmata archaeon]